MKRIAVLSVCLVLIGSLYGQSVVELSRREKARREGLKGRAARVVMNADLAALQKLPAATTPETAAAKPETPNRPNQTPADATREDMSPAVAPNGPLLYNPADADSFKSGGNLEARLKAAHEEVNRLTTQMNLLMQQINILNTMTPRGVYQQQIDETYQKLLKAQDEEAKLKAELNANKANSPEKR
jgi:hypothetical protein